MPNDRTIKRLHDLMKIRQAVIEALANQPNCSLDASHAAKGPRKPFMLTDEQEQVVATYVHALMTDEVATATFQLGPT